MIEGKVNAAFVGDGESTNVHNQRTGRDDLSVEKSQRHQHNTKFSVCFYCATSVTTLVVALVVFVPIYVIFIEPRLDKDWREPVSAAEAVKDSVWGYVEVRPGAHMFWWLYFAKPASNHIEKPFFIWIQGGPSESGTGIGNMLEMGPYDENLIKRQTSWVHYASILFTDQPVGTGYSYVDKPSLMTNSTDQMVRDLFVLVQRILTTYPQFQTVPLYIFGESYGGKIAPLLAKLIHQEVLANRMKCNLVEIVLGGPAVHLLDIVSTYGNFLYSVSLMDTNERDHYNNVVFKQFESSFLANPANSSQLLTSIFSQFPKDVDTYNFLTWNKRKKRAKQLDELMNGVMKRELSVIPSHVSWKEYDTDVYSTERPNMAVPIANTVDFILNSTNINVTVYVGQLDIVVNSLGSEKWLHRLTWPGIENFFSSNRTRLSAGPNPEGFVKTADKFSFYWILNAGHEVPADNSYASELMIRHILNLL